jgi:hypothetical protein
VKEKTKQSQKAGDEIARYDTSFIAIPPSLPSGVEQKQEVYLYSGRTKSARVLGSPPKLCEPSVSASVEDKRLVGDI